MTTMRALSDQLQVELVQTYICGLLVTKNAGGNTLDISAGNCYDPSSGRIIAYAGASAVSAGSLGASQWNQVYIYDSSGTATIEVVNNAHAPSTTYAGNARKGGTNSNRRWIGSFLTTSGSNIYSQNINEHGSGLIDVAYLGAVNAAPFRVLSAVTTPNGSWSSEQSLVGIVPRYVAVDVSATIQHSATTLNVVGSYYSIDGSTFNHIHFSYCNGSLAGGFSSRLQISRSTPGIYYQLNGTNALIYLDITAYRAAR